MIITYGYTSVCSHTLLPLSSLTTYKHTILCWGHWFPLSTQLITLLAKIISMVTKLWRGKMTYKGCEASKSSFQPLYYICIGRASDILADHSLFYPDIVTDQLFQALLMLVGFHIIPLLTFDLQVKLFTHQPLSNDGGWFGRCAGFLSSPISLFTRAK